VPSGGAVLGLDTYSTALIIATNILFLPHIHIEIGNDQGCNGKESGYGDGKPNTNSASSYYYRSKAAAGSIECYEYDSGNTYAFTPSGPTVGGTGGAGHVGTSYTCKATRGTMYLMFDSIQHATVPAANSSKLFCCRINKYQQLPCV
jgi:hypothetical protein